MNRRKFIETSLAGSLATLATANGLSAAPLAASSKLQPISQVKKRVAIAMWDYTWILRHHRYGEFENWDKTLNELAERGYDAIRLDCMPQFVVSGKDGTITEEFRSIKEGWTPAMWGNDYTMSFRPREALLEFLPKCRKYGIRVGLATWFLNHSAGRTDIFMEEGGLFRAWKETLAFLDSHGLLDDNILYVDILNEYPCYHGYDWLKEELNKRLSAKKFKANNPNANIPDPDAGNIPDNYLKIAFQKEFANDILSRLKALYPRLDFFAALDPCVGSFNNIDLTHFDAMDKHIWFVYRGGFVKFDDVSNRNQGKDTDFRVSMKNVRTYFAENKPVLTAWMKDRIDEIAAEAAKHNIVCGNTEGWGPVTWIDHPELDWDWVKESADICVDLALAHPQYKFICTSNFTQPNFKGFWEDVKWHKEITGKIRKG
jgi:sugar phosphate isomerase/epimerase